MGTKLGRIAEISAATRRPIFTSLYHLINEDLLKECHRELDGKKAVGIDKVTKEEYGKQLDSNIRYFNEGRSLPERSGLCCYADAEVPETDIECVIPFVTMIWRGSGRSLQIWRRCRLFENCPDHKRYISATERCTFLLHLSVADTLCVLKPFPVFCTVF